jgi:hypothetical protein
MAGLSSLFGISCPHTYFADQLCDAFTLAPTNACQKLMSQYGLLFRPVRGGGTMYYSDAERIKAYSDWRPLDFIIANKDPDLLNYSAIDLASLSEGSNARFLLADSIFYADNLQQQSAELSPDFSDSALPIQPPVFFYDSSQPLVSAQLSLLDPLQQVCWQQVSSSLPQTAIQIALHGVPPGRYTLQVNGAKVLDFYLSLQPGVHQFGTLAIYPGGAQQSPWMPQACAAISADGVLTNPQYTFSLSPRQTVWRYHIYSTIDLRTWHVQAAPARGASVTSSVPTFICSNPDGPSPWVYESRQAIALEQAPATWNFALTRFLNSERAVRGGSKIKLPYARGATLVAAQAGVPLGGYSDIFVYL